MSVINGQNADATTFNSAFASKSQDNTLQGKQTLARPGSGATVVDTQQAINDVIASDALKIPTAEKGVANGVATLDATTKVPVAQIPDLTASKITDFNTSADARITLQKGAPSGIAPLDGSSKIDSSYLPSYVDDVVEVANYASLPVTGETGKIYVTLDTNKTYRWSGSVYVQIGQPIASTSDVPEGTNLYFTPARVADKQIGIQFQDQGTNLGTTATVDTIDFIGAGIQATRASNKVTVEVTATGGGGGSKNYFSQSSINPDFETGTVSPWQVMTTTWSGNAPTNAPTPGAVVTTFYTNIVNPLAGTTSATMTKGAGVGQYEGVMSGVFSVDREDLAKVLYGSFAYEVVSTASANFDVSGTSTQTLEIWVYNVNANQWIQPAGFRGINQFTGPGQVTFSFQTDSTPANNQYRICLIIRQNTSGAWNLKVDDFKVGPQAIVLGSAMTDWQSYTPTFTGFGTTSNIEFQWRRVGSDLEVRGKFTLGTVTATEARISFPTGLTSASSTQIPSLTVFGTMYTTVNPSNISSTFSVLCNSSLTYFTFGLSQSTFNGSLTSQSAPTAFSSGSQAAFFAKVPIAGWGSFSQMSSDTDTRIVACSVRANTVLTTAVATTVKPQIVDFDTHGTYSLANGLYTCPVSGLYKVSIADFEFNLSTPATTNEIKVYKNGTAFKTIDLLNNTTNPQNGNPVSTVSYMLSCNAGDTLGIVVEGTMGLYGGGTRGASIQYQRLSGPSVVTATEGVNARYFTTAGQTIGTTDTIINFENKSIDSHSSVTTGASWKFVAPVSGKYLASGFITLSSTSARYVYLYINGVLNSQISIGTGSAWEMPFSSTLVNLNAGDYLDFRAKVSPSATLTTTATANYMNIIRVGN